MNNIIKLNQHEISAVTGGRTWGARIMQISCLALFLYAANLSLGITGAFMISVTLIVAVELLGKFGDLLAPEAA